MSADGVRERWRRVAFVALWFASLSCGCSPRKPYVFAKPKVGPPRRPFGPGKPQFERGAPNAVIDGLGHYLFSLPSKALLWNWRVNNHRISPETERFLREYIQANDLTKVKVRLNQYDPLGEAKRLFKNGDVGVGYRATIGALTVLIYTILPERLFGGLIGGDHYNPYTNTISIYSDLGPIALHEGGHAKDFSERTLKGTYGILRFLPIIPLAQEYVASEDAIHYCVHKDYREQQKSGYKLLYPAFCTYILGEVGNLVPLAPGLVFIAVIPGHIAGRIHAASVPAKPKPPARP